MIHPARWTLAILLVLWLTQGNPAFADASVTCTASDGTTHTYTAQGSGCETYYDPNSQIKKASCDNNANVAQCKDGGAGLCVGNCTVKKKLGVGIQQPTSAGAAQPQQKGKVGTVNVGGALQSSSSGGNKGLTTTTTPSALTGPSILGGSSGTGSATTSGSKAKLPTSGTSTPGR